MSYKKIKECLISLCIFMAGSFCILNAQAFAKDINFSVSLDRDHVEVGDMVQLGLVFENTQSVPALQLPEIKGLKAQYIGPSTQMTNVNGQMSSSVTHRYRIVPMQTGSFTLGPFSFSYNNDNYFSEAVDLVVVDRGQAPQRSAAGGSSGDQNNDINGRIFIILSSQKNKVYINEPFEITVKMYINQLSVQGIDYPVINAQGFVFEPFTQPRQFREQLAGKIHDVVEFKTIAYASQQGELTLGPAKMNAKVVTRQKDKSGFFGSDFFDDFGDMFDRAKIIPMNVSSPELSINVLPFPDKDKPKEFSGAVGSFNLEVSAAPLELKAGDPITLKMIINGSGNFDSVQSPVLSSLSGLKTYNSEVQETTAGTKVFEQVVIPQKADINNLPQVKFAFFDPQKQMYFTKTSQPIGLKVLPADEKVAVIIDTSKQAPLNASTRVLGQDIIYIKEHIGTLRPRGAFLYKNKKFIGLNILWFVLFMAVYFFQLRKERLTQDIGYARKLRAPKVARIKIQKAKHYLAQNQKELFYELIFKTLQEYLGHRFNRPSAGMTADIVEELSAAQGLDPQIGEKLKHCFLQCDMARYATAALDQNKMRETLAMLEQVIDYLERFKK
ncbi:MAG: BatD family protein [Candidatus Omnitrophica bacterium]|nr:BatD family protein [Candidatus Omnitrophota bacterium]